MVRDAFVPVIIDGERIAFRTPNYTKILNAMRTEPTLTLADMREITGISIAAIQKLLDQLIQKKYVEHRYNLYQMHWA